MTDNNDHINQLLEKLENLLRRQNEFSREIDNLKIEINRLKASEPSQEIGKPDIQVAKPIKTNDAESKKAIAAADYKAYMDSLAKKQQTQATPNSDKPPKAKSDLERIIGENLINKIGIAITVIGVAIGAKYSIEHDLISPLTRIILGYLAGLALLGIGMKLREKYDNYSAVLVSGAMAIMYFITYSAYSFYGLFPQALAFGLMVVFTAFTVVSALTFNKQIIAHIGFVGAYAVPFLLSEGSGKVVILFSYMAIINLGILILAFKKYWKPLFYSSFGLTWIIFTTWYLSKYNENEHFAIALAFLSVFFAIFYLTFISYKILNKEKIEIETISLVLSNSFIFYGIGYGILSNHTTGEHILGLFTALNAIIHFSVSVIVFNKKLADRNLFYLISGLVLVFITLAVPVQLDGNWVTLLWAGEAVLLFWIGRAKNVYFFERLSYPLIAMAFISIAQDWTTVYSNYNPDFPETKLTPLFNINFLTSFLLIVAFSFINYLNSKIKYFSALLKQNRLYSIASISIPAILLIVIYFAFFLEIANYWKQLYLDSALTINAADQDYPRLYWNFDLEKFQTIWLINYSLLFVSALSIINIVRIKSQQFGILNFILSTIAIIVFLIFSLYNLSELRYSYLTQISAEYYQRDFFNIWIRYISYIIFASTLVLCYLQNRKGFIPERFSIKIDIVIYTSMLWILSSELINLMELALTNQSNKLGLSILWGVYAFLMVALGIWKGKKHLRIGAIILLGITLLKLFFYDISHLNTISKTIVFISLGVLLLVISFLYNKYKYIITDEIKK